MNRRIRVFLWLRRLPGNPINAGSAPRSA
jgi:hypothetical protein